MTAGPRVTFGIIVLNGEPFTRHNLRALYPFAHQIVVAEGASPRAAGIARPDGHSLDGTLEILRAFKAEEDPDNKITIVTAEDCGHADGIWPGEKDEQSQAYAQRADGDYLWQVDIDEFYQPQDMSSVLATLASRPVVTQINVPQLNFWGGFGYVVDGLFLQQYYRAFGLGVPRAFKWGPGYRYTTHRPPTVVDAAGRATCEGTVIEGRELANHGIYCYHYATVLPHAVDRKMQYYALQGWPGSDRFGEWFESDFVRITRPFRVHHVVDAVSWIDRFGGSHPPEIQSMMRDLERSGSHPLRPVDDIERVLASRRYRCGRSCFRLLSPLLLPARASLPVCGRFLERCIETCFSPRLAAAAPNAAGDRRG